MSKTKDFLKSNRTLLFVFGFAMVFMFAPLPLKIPDMSGSLHTIWINGLDGLRIGGLKSFAIGFFSFSGAGFLSSKLGDKE